DLVARLPARFTASLRLQGVETAAASDFLAAVQAAPAALMAAAGLGAVAAVDLTDGWRATDAGGQIVHLRASGNAPEFRIYAEAGSVAHADQIAARALAHVQRALGGV
ncbi:MAG: phosphomannomutase, partial [Paracoccaceae bacterium]